jgi:hypothetical protein
MDVCTREQTPRMAGLYAVCMLSTLIIVLVVLWLLGVVTSYTLGGLVHILLVGWRGALSDRSRLRRMTTLYHILVSARFSNGLATTNESLKGRAKTASMFAGELATARPLGNAMGFADSQQQGSGAASHAVPARG